LSSKLAEQTLACIFAEVRSLQELNLAYSCLLKVVRMRLGPIDIDAMASSTDSAVQQIVEKLRDYALRIRQEERGVQADLDFVGTAYAKAHVGRLIARVQLSKEHVCYREIQRSLHALNVAEIDLIKSGQDLAKINEALAVRLTVLESLRPLMAECQPQQFKQSGTRTALIKQRKIVGQIARKDWEPFLREAM
jgi:hypothetical protein